MNIHKNVRLTPLGRERVVKAVLSGQAPEAAARAAGVCPRTARKWVARFVAEGFDGLKDRSSRPHRLYRPQSSSAERFVIACPRPASLKLGTGRQHVHVGMTTADDLQANRQLVR